jgi:hypothetical protein
MNSWLTLETELLGLFSTCDSMTCFYCCLIILRGLVEKLPETSFVFLINRNGRSGILPLSTLSLEQLVIKGPFLNWTTDLAADKLLL